MGVGATYRPASGRGTAVRLQVPNGLSPLLDEGFIEGVLRKCFAPLLDPRFEPILSRHYPRGVILTVNGRVLPRLGWSGRGETADLVIRLARQRKSAGAGYLLRSDHVLPENEQGVGISTFGKVILRGWDWLGLRPAAPDMISGFIEVPELAACLQTNKAGFIREGPLGAKYLRYHKAIQQAVARQLSAWGADRGGSALRGQRTVRPFERDLEKVIGSLARDFPLLTALGDKRSGGQYRLLGGSAVQTNKPAAPAPVISAQAGRTPSRPPQQEPGPMVGEDSPPTIVAEPVGARRRPGRLQVRIRFEDLPESPELARLVNAVVWINQAHPAYRRSQASRSTGYHVALACCLALAPLAAPEEEHGFICTFLARWGEGAA
jgi:hypothetical protein